MKFCSLFSGSSGNSLFISNGTTKLLVDAGKNGKQVELALNRIGETCTDLTGILLTHEHSDHMNAAGVLSRRYKLPIYANYKTWEALLTHTKIGKIDPELQRVFEMNRTFEFDDLSIRPFKISHDAASPVGFKISDGKKTVGIATDTGEITEDMEALLPGSNLVVLESNHDLGMLETGSYPFYLKTRIKGRFGHLSNVHAAEFSTKLVEEGTEKLVLAHLSRENNLPIIARQTTETALKEKSIKVGDDVILEVANRNQVGSFFKV